MKLTPIDQGAINEFTLMLQQTTDLDPELLNQVALDGYTILTKKLGYRKPAQLEKLSDVCQLCDGTGRIGGPGINDRCYDCKGTGRNDEKLRIGIEAALKSLLDEFDNRAQYLGYDKGYGVWLNPHIDQIVSLIRREHEDTER